MAAPITVAVAVHGGGAIVERCLRRLVAHTDLTRHRLLVVVDGDPEFGAGAVAATLEATAGVELHHKAEAEGFAAAANTAFDTSTGDVVLVNSDVLVAAGWLDTLAQAANCGAHIATVTPWSNDATICSFPRPFFTNPLPPGYNVDRLAELVGRRSLRLRPALPTGVGACLYVRREALEVVGGFDVAAFGRGYGEETDFCFRASAAGFRHLLDDATFVFHRGQSSFGFERATRVRAAEAVMRRRHPGYVAAIATALRNDPAAAARQPLLAALGPPATDKPRVFHLVHGFPPWAQAGTELYAERLAQFQARDREVMVHTRVGAAAPEGATVDQADPDRSLVVRAMVNRFEQRNPLARNAIANRTMAADVARSVQNFRPAIVHIHHLAGHGLSAFDAARSSGAPVVLQVQDWWLACARANLLDHNRQLCPGPSPQRCSLCLPQTRIVPAPVWSNLLYRLRARRARRVLAGADALVMGSQAIHSSLQALGWLPPRVPVHVLDYGTPTPTPQTPAPQSPRPSVPLSLTPTPHSPATPLRLGVIGSLLPHKGFHVALAAMRELCDHHVTLDVWGDPGADPRYSAELLALATPAVHFRGKFPEADREDVLASVDLLLVPSLGLESYGLVVREAFARGLPVIASDRGALPEAFPGLGAGGQVVPAGDSAALVRALRVALEPGQLERWRAHIAPVLSSEDHALAIDEVYRSVLEAAR